MVSSGVLLFLGKSGGRTSGSHILLTAASPKDNSEASAFRALHDTLQQIDAIHQLIDLNPQILGFADDANAVWQVFRSGRIASLIGVEGLHQIGGSASALRQFHRLGVRYITLCHDCNNEYVDSAVSESYSSMRDC